MSEQVDPELSAKTARLRYVCDDGPGIGRERVGDGFRYLSPKGEVVADETTLTRIRSLAIPPAWEAVWICPLANGHIQATGRDVKGRKQYRYHVRWRAVRDATKFGRMIAFATSLPNIRRAIETHLALGGLPREKVLATIVRLLEVTCIRVGNEEYARKNRSYGLTTLRNRHVDVSGSSVRFRFRGKSGKAHAIRVKDRRLARIVARCSELPGQELFQYVDDDGATRTIESSDVNAYIQEVSGSDFTAKDFRTWVGTVSAVRALRELGPAESAGDVQKSLLAAVKLVAERLGNTAAVCRKAYIHPLVLEAWVTRKGSDSIFPPPESRRELSEPTTATQVEGEIVVHVNTPEDDLDADEIATLTFLRANPTGEDDVRALRRKLQKSIALVKQQKREQRAEPSAS
jgi:DNA topoisomerase I